MKLYASLFQLISSLLATIFVIFIIFTSPTPLHIKIAIILLMASINILVYLSYKEKIPLFKIK